MGSPGPGHHARPLVRWVRWGLDTTRSQRTPRPLDLNMRVREHFILAAAIVLSVLTLWVVIYSGRHEPFYGSVSALELACQVGGGFTLSTLWLLWSLCLVAAVHQKVLSAISLLGLILALAGIAFSAASAWGCAHDIYVSTNNLIPH